MNKLPKFIEHAMEFTKIAKTNLIGEWLSSLSDDLLQELLSLTEHFKKESQFVTDLTLFWWAREILNPKITFKLDELAENISMFRACVRLEKDMRNDLIFILDGQVNDYLSLIHRDGVILGCTSKGLLDPELSELALSMGKN